MKRASPRAKVPSVSVAVAAKNQAPMDAVTGKHRSKLTLRQQQRMRTAILLEILRYHKCIELIPGVPAEVLAAGMDLFKTEAAVASWLCEPARALGGRIPMEVAQTPKGAKEVAQILGAISHGVFL